MPLRTLTRRGLLAAVPLAAASNSVTPALAAIEQRAGGRLGVCFFDTKSGKVAGHRLDERFALCSTFKMPLAAFILEELDAGRLQETELIPFSKKDMAPNSPVTTKNLATGAMTPAALAEATQTTSDNTAANLLLAKIGGPAGFTKRLRQSGASKTRVDHYEPRMNLVQPGEENDTTTPRDMAKLTARLLLRQLKPASRDRLIGWMVATQTGAKRLRAGLPAGWRAGDKTGSMWGGPITDKLNDVAIFWPTGRAPVIVTAYFDSSRKSEEIRDEDQAFFAEVGRLAAAWAQG